MPALLELRWEFTPAGIFEEKLICDLGEAKITVEQGTVIAILPLIDGESRSDHRNAVEAHVESLFLGVQVAGHTTCQLGRPQVSTLHDDGSRGYIIECEPGTFKMVGGEVDLRYTRSDGTVVDTRRERIQRKHRLSLAAANYGAKDEALARMLRSYRSAISDAEDELIHHYEVLDTLKSKFGTQAAALNRLNQSKPKWSRLGEICNVLPLLQGRHRGRIGALRSASEEELAEARTLSAGFIESYVEYLERPT